MTPTQRKIRKALTKAGKPLTYYELSTRTGVKGGSFDKAVLDFLDQEVLVEVKLGEIVGLKLNGC